MLEVFGWFCFQNLILQLLCRQKTPVWSQSTLLKVSEQGKNTQVCKHKGLCTLFPSENTRWAASALGYDVHVAVFLLFPNSTEYPFHSWREAVPLSWAVSDLYMLCIGPVSSDQRECSWGSCHRKPQSIFSPEWVSGELRFYLWWETLREILGCC